MHAMRHTESPPSPDKPTRTDPDKCRRVGDLAVVQRALLPASAPKLDIAQVLAAPGAWVAIRSAIRSLACQWEGQAWCSIVRHNLSKQCWLGQPARTEVHRGAQRRRQAPRSPPASRARPEEHRRVGDLAVVLVWPTLPCNRADVAMCRCHAVLLTSRCAAMHVCPARHAVPCVCVCGWVR